MRRRDRLTIRLGAAGLLILPWPVAIVTHDEALAVASALAPALIAGALLRRRGWTTRGPRPD